METSSPSSIDHRYWESRLIREASLYPSLRYLNLQQFSIGKPHTIIRYNTTYRGDIIKCKIKLLLVTGSYILQAQRSKFNQFEVNSTCLLCGQEPENREHFLSTRQALAGHRSIYTSQLSDVLTHHLGPVYAAKIMNSSAELTQLILDCTSGLNTGIAPITRDVSRKIELITQRLLYALHLTCKNMLALIAPMHRRPRPSKKKVTNNNTLYLQQHCNYGLNPVPQSIGGRPVQGRNRRGAFCLAETRSCDIPLHHAT